jgi:hypothetical protein
MEVWIGAVTVNYGQQITIGKDGAWEWTRLIVSNDSKVETVRRTVSVNNIKRFTSDVDV